MDIPVTRRHRVTADLAPTSTPCGWERVCLYDYRHFKDDQYFDGGLIRVAVGFVYEEEADLGRDINQADRVQVC